MTPLIIKPTRITKKVAAAIDHIITKHITSYIMTSTDHISSKTAILKSDIRDNFSIFLSPMIDGNKNEVTYIYIYISKIYKNVYIKNSMELKSEIAKIHLNLMKYF